MTSKSIQGFTVIPIYISKENATHHDLFVKEHSVRNYDENKPPGRTLFAINLPPYANEDNLNKVFSAAGKIKTITLQATVSEESDLNESQCGFKVAYIVFEKREGLLKSLKLERLNLIENSSPVSFGLRKWIHEYNSSVYNHEKLYEEVTNFVKNSEKEEAKQNEQPAVDDEGWTVVTKKGRNPGISRKESVENKIIQKNKLKSRKKELKNFYTFQLKEQKMKSIAALRKSFQDSKEKVNLMKKLRNFKPF